MAIKCPDCGHWNDNNLMFCEECGEPIDPQTRLIMELEGKKKPAHHASNMDSEKTTPSARRRADDDDDEYIAPSFRENEKKIFPPGLLLILAGVAGLVYFLFVLR